MREILFRGKRTDNHQWVEGFYLLDDPGGNPYIINRWKHRVAHKSIGQFTGLTDKNGKKIFEGDIIKIPNDYDTFGHNAGEIYEIYFAYGGFRLKPKYNSQCRGYYLEDDKTVDVVDNIHDNPELLEVTPDE